MPRREQKRPAWEGKERKWDLARREILRKGRIQ